MRHGSWQYSYMYSNPSSVLGVSPEPLTDAVEALVEAAATVSALVAEGMLPWLTVEELLGTTRALHAVGDSVRAAAVAATAVVEERDAARAVGCTSTTHWLTREAGLSTGGAGATVGTGRALVDYPATRAAWLAGEVSEASVREITTGIARVVRGLPDEHAARERARCEGILLHVARTRTPVDVRRAAARLRIEVDPAAAAAAAEAARDAEHLSFTVVPDGVEVRGFLATETAAAVLTSLDRIVDDLHRSGTLAWEERVALDSGQPARRRATRAALHARALGILAGTVLEAGALGSRHGQRPHVTYTVHHDDVVADRGGQVLLPGLGPVPVPTATIERILCDAEVHPVLTRRADEAGGLRPLLPPQLRASFGPAPPGEDDSGPPPDEYYDDDTLEAFGRRLTGERGRHVLDHGRTFRTAPPDLRRALEVRDGGCVMPGCHADPSRCEAHHVVYWRHGGTTSLRDMALVCPAHHHDLHEGGWMLYADAAKDAGEPDRWIVVPPAPHLAYAA
jgi:hypothetical protein